MLGALVTLLKTLHVINYYLPTATWLKCIYHFLTITNSYLSVSATAALVLDAPQ